MNDIIQVRTELKKDINNMSILLTSLKLINDQVNSPDGLGTLQDHIQELERMINAKKKLLSLLNELLPSMLVKKLFQLYKRHSETSDIIDNSESTSYRESDIINNSDLDDIDQSKYDSDARVNNNDKEINNDNDYNKEINNNNNHSKESDNIDNKESNSIDDEELSNEEEGEEYGRSFIDSLFPYLFGINQYFNIINNILNIHNLVFILSLPRNLQSILQNEPKTSLTNQEIDKIEEINFNESISEKQCCICLFDYSEDDKINKLKCSHIFHSSCMRKWLLLNDSCPLCRKKVVI